MSHISFNRNKLFNIYFDLKTDLLELFCRSTQNQNPSLKI